MTYALPGYPPFTNKKELLEVLQETRDRMYPGLRYSKGTQAYTIFRYALRQANLHYGEDLEDPKEFFVTDVPSYRGGTDRQVTFARKDGTLHTWSIRHYALMKTQDNERRQESNLLQAARWEIRDQIALASKMACDDCSAFGGTQVHHAGCSFQNIFLAWDPQHMEYRDVHRADGTFSHREFLYREDAESWCQYHAGVTMGRLVNLCKRCHIKAEQAMRAQPRPVFPADWLEVEISPGSGRFREFTWDGEAWRFADVIYDAVQDRIIPTVSPHEEFY